MDPEGNPADVAQVAAAATTVEGGVPMDPAEEAAVLAADAARRAAAENAANRAGIDGGVPMEAEEEAAVLAADAARRATEQAVDNPRRAAEEETGAVENPARNIVPESPIVDDFFVFENLEPLPTARRTPFPVNDDRVQRALQEEIERAKQEESTANNQGRGVQVENLAENEELVREEARRMMEADILRKKEMSQKEALDKKRKRTEESKAEKARKEAKKKEEHERRKAEKAAEKARLLKEQTIREELQREEEEERIIAEGRRKEEEERRAQQQNQQEAGPSGGASSRPPKIRFKQRVPAHMGPGGGAKLKPAAGKGKKPGPWTQEPAPPPPKTKKKYRFRPGTVALREIRKFQKSTDLIMAKAPFSRLVREVMEELSGTVTRIQGTAMLALQEAAEQIIVSLFVDTVMCMAHAKRLTIKPSDMKLAMALRGDPSLRK